MSICLAIALHFYLKDPDFAEEYQQQKQLQNFLPNNLSQYISVVVQLIG